MAERKRQSQRNILFSPSESKQSFDLIISNFFANCEQNNITINKKNVAVLYRGKDYAKYLGLNIDKFDYQNIPWADKNHHVKVKDKTLVDWINESKPNLISNKINIKLQVNSQILILKL
ncbi:MAG: hypothetical protein IPL10_03655 [Bacteroidetes bacterium]|nr:hypothetical protein [Bacteroidota bacterium]